MDSLPIKITWTGEQNRPLNVRRHCDCGTCRGFASHVAPSSTGYLSWSDEKGHGGSIFLDEQDYQQLEELLQENPFITLSDCLSILNLT